MQHNTKVTDCTMNKRFFFLIRYFSLLTQILRDASKNLTFGLDLLAVGRNDDTLNLIQLHVLGYLSETHDQAAFGFSLGGIFLVDSLLEANQFLQEQSHALIDLLTQHLVTVSAHWAKNKRMNDF